MMGARARDRGEYFDLKNSGLKRRVLGT